MKKFECNGCGGHCTLTTMLEYKPNMCFRPEEDWQEVKEDKEIKESKLPKLTAEVFERPDCPEWVNYAAVDKSGMVFVYTKKPKVKSSTWDAPCGDFLFIGSDFDASDWQNSLIERPAKIKLPDWCKAAKWGYDTEREEYFEIVAVTPFNVEVAYLDGEFTMVIGIPIFNGDCVQARKRPFNAEEMKALVGKVIEKGPSMHLVIGFENVFENECMIHVNNCMYSGNDLIRHEYTIDGKLCCKFEHFENGKWVE